LRARRWFWTCNGTIGAAVCGTAIALAASAVAATPIPRGFVYLAHIDPSIVQDIRYAGRHNFVGRRIAGYGAAECILTEKAAMALKQVQTELSPKGLSLIVWDCYRPARAVADFVKWSSIPVDTRMKTEFYPRTDKAKLFSGYLSIRSAHSRGSAVDLGIVADNAPKQAYDPSAAQHACYAPKGERFEDGTLDFGTGYDCLDVSAGSENPNISEPAQANRTLLLDLMRRAGFKPYRREWWHFELTNEPFPGQPFDFPIKRRPSK
jgi:D-alanyl-D-alanine dipeptidase